MYICHCRKTSYNIMWLAVLLLGGAIFADQIAYYVAPQGLAETGSREWTGGVQNAVMEGAAALTADELNRPALSLSGEGGSFSINLSDGVAAEFTLSFWLRARSFPQSDDPRLANAPELAEQGQIADWGDGFKLMLLPERRIFFKMVEGNDLLLWERLLPLVRKDEWTHLALTWSTSRGEAQFFWNGYPVAKRWTHAPIKLADGGSRLLFGGKALSFNGEIAEIRLFNEALRAPDVARLARPARNEMSKQQEDSWVLWPVPPYSGTPILPDTPSGKAAPVRMRLCRGERESASFAMRSAKAHPQVQIGLAGALKDGAGHEIAAELLRVQVVKCWYQAGYAWVDPEPVDKSLRVLVPELLLNDDELVRVDCVARANHVRLNDRYENCSRPEERTDHIWINRLHANEFPVRDAASLRPFDLPAQCTRQIWLKLGPLPKDTPAGQYSGVIRITAADGTATEQPLTVEVLPFQLLEPVTHDDASRPYVCSLYDTTWVHSSAGGIDPFLRNLDQYRTQLADMLAHGVNQPLCCALSAVSEPEYFRAMLRTRAEAGMKMRPLYIFNNGQIENTLKEAPTPERLQQVREWTRQILDTVEAELGHRDVFVYGVDEAQGEALKQQLAYWEAIHAEGAKVYTSGHHGPEEVNGQQDVMNQYKVVSAANAAAWHRYGKSLWSYGHPQAGAEDPELNRRNYGLHLWRLGYDGICTYVYYDMWGNPWNDFDSANHRDIGFVYPTVDGVVDTLSWEGYAAAITDVRYVCTLRAAALSRKDHPKAAEALQWLEDADYAEGDLDQLRNAIIDRILELR